MATQSSILAWEIPGTEELGGLQSIGLQKVGHDLATEYMCMVVLCSAFSGTALLFSTVAISIYIPTNRARGFPFSVFSPAFIVHGFS